jgi:hypothetical protein
MGKFSEYALEKLLDLYGNHSHEVGSELKKKDPVAYKAYEATDCITYALNVIGYAFKKAGSDDAARSVWARGKRGTELAAYLVDDHRWKGIYINPDVNHPLDIDSEHSYTAHLANRTCRYYGIRIEYRATNYTVTPKTHPSFKKLNKNAGPTPLNDVDIASLDSVKFGFGISRGGRHTWLFSEGKVYEVHWDKIGDELYEASSLRAYPWLSGAIVVPPDQAHRLAASAQLRCGT